MPRIRRAPTSSRSPSSPRRALSPPSFDAAPLASDARPAFAPSEDWPVLTTSLRDPNDVEAGAKEQFTRAYMTNGTFVSGIGALTIGFPFPGVVIHFPLHHAIVTMDISEDGTRVTN